MRDEVLEIFEQSVKRQTAEAEETKKQLSALREVMKELSAGEGKYTKEIEDLKYLLSGTKEKKNKYAAEVKRLTAELGNAKLKMNEAIDGATQSSKLTLDLQNEIDAQKKSQADSILSQKAIEGKLSKKDNEITKLKQKIESEASNLRSLSAELQVAKGKLSAHDPNELVRLKAELVGLKRENENLQKNVGTTPITPSAPPPKPPIQNVSPVREQQSDNNDEFSDLNQAVQRNLRDTIALLKIAEAYISKDRFLEAIPFLKNLIKLKPNDPEAHFNLGNTFYKADKFQESIPPLNLAVRLNPKMAKAHYNLCMVNELVGQEDAANKHYKIALRLDPKIESSM